jgi:hypothetical protein
MSCLFFIAKIGTSCLCDNHAILKNNYATPFVTIPLILHYYKQIKLESMHTTQKPKDTKAPVTATAASKMADKKQEDKKQESKPGDKDSNNRFSKK